MCSSIQLMEEAGNVGGLLLLTKVLAACYWYWVWHGLKRGHFLPAGKVVDANGFCDNSLFQVINLDVVDLAGAFNVVEVSLATVFWFFCCCLCSGVPTCTQVRVGG